MKKNLEKQLLEMFGDPLEPKMGTRVGEVPGITTFGAVGVRDMRENELGTVCPHCGMMPIDGRCGCTHDVEESDDGVCNSCKMMAPSIGSSCGCMSEAKSCMCEEDPCECSMNEMDEEVCEVCGELDEVCECGYMNEGKRKKRKKRKGPSKKTAQKILRGTKTFKQKMKKVSGWASDPGAAAAWMMHKATGKWPSEK